VLNTDNKIYGGYGFVDDNVKHATVPDPLYASHKKEWLKLYIPARTGVVLRKKK
jgi:1,4-alpha-glucan branching enzyme